MKKKVFSKNGVTKTTEKIKPQIIVNELRVVSADRSSRDIADVKISMVGAESVYNPNRTRLYDMYDYIELDGHLTGIVNKRIDAVVNKEIYFENASKKKSDEIDALIDSEKFRDLMRSILETKFYGCTGVEFIPGQEFNFEPIPRKHIIPEKSLIKINQNDSEGIEYSNLDNVWVMGKPKDLGLYLKCAPYVIWKRGNMGDWAQYIEIFGQPVRIVKYDAYDIKTREEVRKVLDESGSSLALMIPKQADFEMKDGKQSNGDGQLHERFKTAIDNELSVLILGNTESTTSSKSSGYAQSKTHSDQQFEVTKADMSYVRSKLNSEKFIKILASYGFNTSGGRFVFEKETNLDEVKTKLDIFKSVKEMGIPIDDDDVYETAGIPKPVNYNEQKNKQEATSNPIPGVSKKAKKEGEKTTEEPQQELIPKQISETKKTAQKPLKKENLFFRLRAALADFFDQPR